ncbi:MAG: class I tRNA ligase family protein [Mycoplasmataceae bacterium]|nr:class I tRNA ligase family protein [Mycoplasmataceae bacterium]
MSFKHLEIEKKWKIFWKVNNIYKTNIDTNKKTFYALDMFPYPSGAGLHVGHPKGYTATDIVSRFKKAKGYEVLHPIGWDAFGLPAEQYAIQTGNSPIDFTNKNIEVFRKQLNSLGFSFDWDREINTTDPEYFKNTQWIFAQLYKKGLAEIMEVEANWSPSLNTVLANEEILEDVNGNFVDERNGMPIEKRKMKQWVLKITKYAQKLFDGLEDLDWPESVKKLQKNWLYKKNKDGKYSNIMHIRDWIFARQRYWGEPFPIIHLENGETYLIPETEYPIKLPKIKKYKFTQDGEPALGNSKEWVNVQVNGIKGKRDLNTMPQWAGSNWYYMGYILKDGKGYLSLDDPKAKERLNKWLPVDLYIGGQEHAVLHLIYSRFWHIFLNEIGITDIKEPFQKLYNQGMILGSDGLKMSKSKGNVINPNEIVKEFGADTLRIYEMFMGSLDDNKSWSSKGLQSSRNWLERVYKFFTNIAIYENPTDNIIWSYNEMLEEVEKLYESLKFNVAISKMMIFINSLYKESSLTKEMAVGFLQVLSCISPHIADEIHLLITGKNKTLYGMKWPSKIKILNKKNKDRIIVLQTNGKVRYELINPKLSLQPTQNELKDFAFLNLKSFLSSKKEIKKIIFIKKTIINVVI